MDIEHTIQHFLSDCEIRNLTPGAIDWYKRHLTPFARHAVQVAGIAQLEAVKIVHLRQFIQALMSTHVGDNHPRMATQDRLLSPSTVRGYVRALKVFFRWSFQEELIEADPSARLVLPKMPKYLIPAFTVEHIDKMLAACDINTPNGLRDSVIVLLLLDTGMRISELCGLCLADIHPNYVKVTGKGRQEREIGLHPNVARLLWRYISKARKAPENVASVFIGRGGAPLRTGGVDSLLGRVKRASGVEGVRVSAHTFRHTFAKFYLERGGALFDLSREMGHSSVQVTEIYLKDYHSTEARKKHSAYSPVDLVKLPAKSKHTRKPKGS